MLVKRPLKRTYLMPDKRSYNIEMVQFL